MIVNVIYLVLIAINIIINVGAFHVKPLVTTISNRNSIYHKKSKFLNMDVHREGECNLMLVMMIVIILTSSLS